MDRPAPPARWFRGRAPLGFVLVLVIACALWVAVGLHLDRPAGGARPVQEAQPVEPGVDADPLDGRGPGVDEQGPRTDPSVAARPDPARSPAPGTPLEARASSGPAPLIALVLDAAGRPVDGVPVAPWIAAPGLDPLPFLQELRISGSDPGTRGDGAAPPRPGEVRWSPDESPLRELLQAPVPGARLELGLALPGLAGDPPPRLTVPLDPLPDGPVVLSFPEQARGLVRPLRVEVLHADGRPAVDVPVATVAIPADPALGTAGESVAGRTDEHGVVLVPRGELLRTLALFSSMLLRQGAEGPPREAVERLFELRVTVDLPLGERPFASFRALPREPESVRLELPPLGRLVVEASGPAGAPLEPCPELEVRLSWTRAPEPPRNQESRRTLSVRSREPAIDLGPVGVGLDLELRAWTRDGSRPGANLALVGPAREGETRRVPLELGAAHPELSLRLLGPDDAPLAAARVRHLERAPGPPPEHRPWRSATTDGDGRLSWHRTDPAPGARLVEVRAEVQGEQLVGSRVLPDPAPEGPGPHPLGDLRLTPGSLPEPAPAPPPALLAAGRIVDAEGRPVPRAEVRARRAAGHTNLASTHSGDDGAFELRDDAADPFYLVLSAPGYVARSTSALEPGRVDHLLELAPAGGLRGRLLLPPFAGDLRVDVEVDGVRRRARRGPDGGFTVDGLPAGRARLSVRDEELGRTFLEVHDLEVLAGEPREEPRLARLDLREAVREVWLEVAWSDGRAADGWLRVAVDGGREDSLDLAGRTRRRVLLPASAARLSLRLADSRPTEVLLPPLGPSGSDDLRVVLEPR